MTSIGRHYFDNHVKVDNFETRVAIYEDQVRGWFHDQARILEKCSDNAGFVLLLVALSYVEGHAIFYKGEDSRCNSRSFFRDAFKAIFRIESEDPEIVRQVVDELYEQMRNGLFHTGMTRSKVILSGQFPDPVRFVLDQQSKTVLQIQVNPHEMLNGIEDHLSHYVMRLRNPDEKLLRNNFDKAWKLRHA